MNLEDKVNSISSREDLVSFVCDLCNSLRDDANSWENDTLERYLDALAAWINGIEGYYKNRGEVMIDTPSWKLIGEILLAAKYYE